MRFLSPVPSERFRSVSPGLVGLLCTNIFGLARKGCGLARGTKPRELEARVGGWAEPLSVSAPDSRLHVSVGTEDCDEL